MYAHKACDTLTNQLRLISVNLNTVEIKVEIKVSNLNFLL